VLRFVTGIRKLTLLISVHTDCRGSLGLLCNGVVYVAEPMRNVSWMLFPGGMELGTQVKTGSRAGRTHSQ